MLNPDFLLTAKHAHPRVNNERDYRARQAEAVAGLMQMFQHLPWKGVHIVEAQPQVFVSGGRVLVECSCGNCPMVEPEWGAVDGDKRFALALCYECGATYERIELPVDLVEIERLLVKRAHPSLRYWNPQVTLDSLREINAQLGITE